MVYKKKTYKNVTDPKILEIWEEVKAEAKGIYPHYFETCEPELYMDSSYRHLGLCSYSMQNPTEINVDKIKIDKCIITISSNLGQDYDQIRKTMCHELGHFVSPKEHHSYLWQARANRIGSRWGIGATRTTNNETFNNAIKEQHTQRTSAYKYRLYCPECGTEWKYKTNCSAVQHPQYYRCSKCKSALKSEKIQLEV